MLPVHVDVPLSVSVVVPMEIGAVEPMVSAPDTVTFELKVLVPLPLVVRLLKVVMAAMVWAAPPKFTVPVPAVKTEPVPFHAVALVLFSLSVLEPPFKDPAVRVTLPVKVCVNELPRLSVPPEPLIVKPAPLTAPCSVAVPPVLVIVVRPVVVYPAMFCVAVLPIVMAELPAVNAPLFVKSPLNVMELLAVASVVVLLIVSAPLKVRPVAIVVVPPVIVRLLKVVKTAAGRLFVAVNWTVPAPAVKVLLVLAIPSAKPCVISVPPFVMSKKPMRLDCPASPSVTVPATVSVWPAPKVSVEVLLFVGPT